MIFGIEHNALSIPTCSLTQSFLCTQEKLYSGRWNGIGKNHPVHHISVWDFLYGDPWTLPYHCPTVYYYQLGERVSHLDAHECHCVSWLTDQPADDPSIWDVLQRSRGTDLIYDFFLLLNSSRCPLFLPSFFVVVFLFLPRNSTTQQYNSTAVTKNSTTALTSEKQNHFLRKARVAQGIWDS